MTLDDFKILSQELKIKAYKLQLLIDLCASSGGHIWEYGTIYWSNIDRHNGSSMACERCGCRKSLNAIDAEELRSH